MTNTNRNTKDNCHEESYEKFANQTLPKTGHDFILKIRINERTQLHRYSLTKTTDESTKTHA
jgi:trehalose-6-phosphate synthase